MAPPPSHTIAWNADSGVVASPKAATGAQAVYSTIVTVPDAAWLRLGFGSVRLPGRIAEGGCSYLRITSVQDGAVQYLNSESLAQWAQTSAYFNGDTVMVELLAYAGSGSNQVSVRSVTVGEHPGVSRSICGPTDDRVIFGDPRLARHLPEGCTSWLIADINHTFITAGHCGVSAGDVQEFNVPFSDSTGSLNHPAPEDQYVVDPSSVQFHFDGSILVGEDFSYFACYPNSNTGLTPYQRQRQYFFLAPSIPAAAGQSLRITGYGTTSGGQAPLEWSQVEKTGFGPFLTVDGTVLEYQVDTSGGNSGSPIEDLSTGMVIGIHTNGGCLNPTGSTYNAGCAVNYLGLQAALANPLSLCRTGGGITQYPLFAIGDGANNFGTVQSDTGQFAKIKDAPPRMEGLAYNWNIGRFYAISNDVNPASPGRYLYTIDPSSGNASMIATISGTPYPINGLGYDPYLNVLYGVTQATGQLVVINPVSGFAQAVSPVTPGTMIGGLEYNPVDRTVYGIDNGSGTSALVRWNNPNLSPVFVGYLGAGVSGCNGLAVTDSGDLWTISATSGMLLRVDRFTGQGTVIGPTNGVFGNSFGMSAVLTPRTCYANCDQSTIPPVLNANDFQCYLNAFAAGSSYANCDGSVNPPILNANDFQCFLNAFAAGCP